MDGKNTDKKAINSHFKFSIQAKLWNSNHRPEHVKPDLEATLKDLGVRLLNDDGMNGTQRIIQINIHQLSATLIPLSSIGRKRFRALARGAPCVPMGATPTTIRRVLRVNNMCMNNFLSFHFSSRHHVPSQR